MKDEGYFGPHSMAWRVHSNPVTLVGGVRALLIQALHPLAMAGILEHSVVTGDISGRYMRTRDFVLAAIFGDRATADEAGAPRRGARPPPAGGARGPRGGARPPRPPPPGWGRSTAL